MKENFESDDQARDTENESTFGSSSIDPEQIYKMVQDAFGDLNATYASMRKSALEAIEARPLYALVGAAVIGVAVGVALRNQIVAAGAKSASKNIKKH